jgi:hypothetical protein
MTTHELLVLTKTFLKDVKYFDEEICAILDIAQREFALNTRILTKHVNIDILEGEQAWAYGNDVVKIYSVILASEDKLLQRVSRAYLNKYYPDWVLTTTKATPDLWITHNFELHLRAPAIADDTLILTAAVLPTATLSCADLGASPEIPVAYHMALVWHTLSVLLDEPKYQDRYMQMICHAHGAEIRNYSTSKGPQDNWDKGY